jgi:Glyoxalase-like domain
MSFDGVICRPFADKTKDTSQPTPQAFGLTFPHSLEAHALILQPPLLANQLPFMQTAPMNQPRKARPLDHLVLPTLDLAVSQKRHEQLGFVVAARGIHPFGTENACVYLADGTFLEPLAMGQRETAEAASLDGNVFTARDAAFRFRKGQEGFSAVVFGSADASGDQAQFERAGISAGKILDFGRDFHGSDGKSARMDFRLAFAADLRSPDSFFFTCQRINEPKADRSKLIAHKNGAVSIKTVLMSEPNPTDFQYLLQEVVNERDVEAHSFGMDIRTGKVTLSVLTHPGLKAFYDLDTHGERRGILMRGIVFGVSDLAKTKYLLTSRAVAFVEKAGKLIVKPTVGQGAAYIFEAAQ